MINGGAMMRRGNIRVLFCLLFSFSRMNIVIQTALTILDSALGEYSQTQDPWSSISDVQFEQGLRLLLIAAEECEQLSVEKRTSCVRALINTALARINESVDRENTLLDKLFHTTFEWLNENDLEDKDDYTFAEQIVNLWIPHTHSLSHVILTKTLESIISNIITDAACAISCITTLYAALLSTTNSSLALSIESSSSSSNSNSSNSNSAKTILMRNDKIRQQHLMDLCQADIPDRFLIPLITAFQSIPLGGEQLELLLECFQRHLPLVTPDNPRLYTS
ncbi:hypothetical protein BDF22DRAFT_376525 [Syncephalis plumigaleata]|nr:hypothetical protein BDF22DRAFT_376525 [Syncephalis plumigaleata]